jgi:hypothetical protein
VGLEFGTPEGSSAQEPWQWAGSGLKMSRSALEEEEEEDLRKNASCEAANYVTLSILFLFPVC